MTYNIEPDAPKATPYMPVREMRKENDMDLDKTPRTNEAWENAEGPSTNIADVMRAKSKELERELNRLRNPAPVDEKEFNAMALRIGLEEGLVGKYATPDEEQRNLVYLRCALRLRDRILKGSAAGCKSGATDGAGERSASYTPPADQSQGAKHER